MRSLSWLGWCVGDGKSWNSKGSNKGIGIELE